MQTFTVQLQYENRDRETNVEICANTRYEAKRVAERQQRMDVNAVSAVQKY